MSQGQVFDLFRHAKMARTIFIKLVCKIQDLTLSLSFVDSGAYTLKWVGKSCQLRYSTVSGIVKNHKSKT